MSDREEQAGLVVLLIIAGFWLWTNSNKVESLEMQVENLSDTNYRLEAKVSAYNEALQEANYNIEEANSEIDDAKSMAWESYEEMGDALDNLDNVETVSEP